jgi:hypothetical protein
MEPRTRLGKWIAASDQRQVDAHADDPTHWELPAWAFLAVLAAVVGFAVLTVIVSDALGIPSRVAEVFAWTVGAAMLVAGGRCFARKFGTRPKNGGAS